MKRLERKGSNGKSVGERVPDEVDTFCSREQLDSNVRFELLRRRADEVKPFGHLTMVPSRPDEIPNHLAQVFHFQIRSICWRRERSCQRLIICPRYWMEAQ